MENIGYHSKKTQEHFKSLNCTQAYEKYWLSNTDITTMGASFYRGLEERQIEEPDRDFARAERAFLEATYCKIVDHFQTYIVRLVADIFALRPEMLPDFKVSSRALFTSDSIEDLRLRAIEQGASRFSYMNVVDLMDELKSRYGFSIVESHFAKTRLKRIVEIRNIAVHNFSIINTTFIEKVGSKNDRVGEVIQIPHPLNIEHYLDVVAVNADTIAIQKFGLFKSRDIRHD
ncbi:hypothetical protein [Alteriqipengyuania lutimaris]|uniref:hypothetical protein n=1 Tax=Alteriqipengyuania lutimaris TaxID=1538146 RepID=UPI001CFDCADF|nr:hypothetical protein [Alteriqipengyuania lutimaris]